jgi:hypothetical protein
MILQERGSQNYTEIIMNKENIRFKFKILKCKYLRKDSPSLQFLLFLLYLNRTNSEVTVTIRSGNSHRFPCKLSRSSKTIDPRVEAGSNTSTVTLRVVGGDEKGSLKSETAKYGRQSQGTRTL